MRNRANVNEVIDSLTSEIVQDCLRDLRDEKSIDVVSKEVLKDATEEVHDELIASIAEKCLKDALQKARSIDVVSKEVLEDLIKSFGFIDKEIRDFATEEVVRENFR